jgi:hypothetical protein
MRVEEVLVRVPKALVDAVHAAKNVDAYKEYNDAPSPCDVARQYEISALMRLGEAVFSAQPVEEVGLLDSLRKKVIDDLLGVDAGSPSEVKTAYLKHLDSFFVAGWNEALDVFEGSMEADAVWPKDWKEKGLDIVAMTEALIASLRRVVWGVPWVWKGDVADAMWTERLRLLDLIKKGIRVYVRFPEPVDCDEAHVSTGATIFLDPTVRDPFKKLANGCEVTASLHPGLDRDLGKPPHETRYLCGKCGAWDDGYGLCSACGADVARLTVPKGKVST